MESKIAEGYPVILQFDKPKTFGRAWLFGKHRRRTIFAETQCQEFPAPQGRQLSHLPWQPRRGSNITFRRLRKPGSSFIVKLVLEGRRIAADESRQRKVRTPQGAMPRNSSPFD